MKTRSSLVALVIAMTCPLLAPAAEAAKKQPDLALTEGALKGKDVHFIGERLKLDAQDATINLGAAKAGPTLTRMYLAPGGGKKNYIELSSRAVGALKPGKIDRGSEGVRPSLRIPPGGYAIVVCVDVKDQVAESDEGNNCSQASSPDRFYAAYREWEGSITGTAPGVLTPDAIETWKSTDATFEYKRHVIGQFQYGVAGGSVTFKFSGSSSTCGGYAGGGTFALDRNYGALYIDYNSKKYTGAAGPTLGSQYNLTSACGQDTWGAHGSIFNPQGVNLPKEASELKGAAAEPTGLGGNFTWALEGK